MNPSERAPASHQYEIAGLEPVDLMRISDLVVSLGGIITPLELAPQPHSRIKTVTLEDILEYGHSSANSLLEAERNPTSAKTLWTRCQQLAAAKEAHKAGVQLTATFMGKTRPLPRSSPLKFLDASELPNAEQNTPTDWLDWSISLDKLSLASLKLQIKRLDSHIIGKPHPFGVGIGKDRLYFLQGFVAHVTNTQ